MAMCLPLGYASEDNIRQRRSGNAKCSSDNGFIAFLEFAEFYRISAPKQNVKHL